MINYQTAVGTVISVAGNIVSVQLSDTVKSNSPIIDGVVYRIGQIGSFLKIPLGYCNLYGIVTQIGASAIPANILDKYLEKDFDYLTNQQWLTMSLIGEQIGTRFERGVSQSPTTGDAVHLVTISDLKNIYSDYNQVSSINVGNISVSESLNAFLDLDKLVSRHFAILGSTGSGKSNAVGITINSIIEKNFKRTRIIILDPHGEYNTAFKSHSKVFKTGNDNPQEALYVPYWALPFNELLSLFEAPISDLNRDYFRSKIVEYKIQGAKTNGIPIDTALITADSPIPFSMKQLWFDLDDFERQTFNERGKPETIISSFRRSSQLFEYKFRLGESFKLNIIVQNRRKDKLNFSITINNRKCKIKLSQQRINDSLNFGELKIYTVVCEALCAGKTNLSIKISHNQSKNKTGFLPVIEIKDEPYCFLIPKWLNLKNTCLSDLYSMKDIPVVLYGGSGTGKSTLIKQIFADSNLNKKYTLLNFDGQRKFIKKIDDTRTKTKLKVLSALEIRFDGVLFPNC